MKFLLSLIFIAGSVHMFYLVAQVRSHLDEDYGVGLAVGRCLVAKCKVFRGFLATDSPKSGTPVTVKVQEELFGMSHQTAIVSVPYSTEILPKAPSESPGYVWEKVRLSKNAPLTIVLATERVGHVEPGAAVFVTSDERTAEEIRSLTDVAKRLAVSPDSISEVVASLASIINPTLAGYVHMYLVHFETRRNPDRGSALLVELVGSPSIPSGSWESVAVDAQANYYRSSLAGRATVVGRFAEIAQNSDVRAASAALRGLERIANDDQSVRSLLPPAALSGLGDSYRALVTKGSIQRIRTLESEFGIAYRP